VDFCASLIGWLPNGTLAKLDDVCGRGEARVNVERVRKYAEAWKNSPGEVGVIVLLTYVDGASPDGHTLARTAKSFTIQPDRVLIGESVRATIKVRGEPPAQPPKGNAAPPDVKCTLVGSCYYWTLDKVYASETNAPIPLVAARVSDRQSASFIKAVNVELDIPAAFYRYAYFTGGAAVVKNASGDVAVVDYSADIYTLAISNITFSVSKKLVMYPEVQGPGIAVVGFYGDYAVVRYREVQCTAAPDGSSCTPTDYYAVLYLMRPAQPPAPYGEVLPLDSWVGDMFDMAFEYWHYRMEYDGPFVGVGFASRVSVPLIRPPRGEGAAVYNLVAGVGVSRVVCTMGAASAKLNTDDPRYFIYAVYYLPPVKFEYQGDYYPLPSLFVDFRVSAPTLDRDAESTT